MYSFLLTGFVILELAAKIWLLYIIAHFALKFW